jgi:hypothetical protein
MTARVVALEAADGHAPLPASCMSGDVRNIALQRLQRLHCVPTPPRSTTTVVLPCPLHSDIFILFCAFSVKTLSRVPLITVGSSPHLEPPPL